MWRKMKMRKTKIICTIGPASENPETLEELMKAGMNVARFNFSHGDHAEQKKRFDNVIAIGKKLNLPVATLLDTKGPEIRLKEFTNGKEELVKGQKFTLTTEEVMGDNTRCSITYKGLVNDVEVGGRILIDDGLIELKVLNITDTDIECEVINGGKVSNKKGVNVPGANLSMPFISEVDRNDIIFGAKTGFDIIACSFVRRASDILEVRKLIEENDGHMTIIAKIENKEGVDNLEEIMAVSDGVMVARGDMGVEIPLEEVPILQKRMIKLAEANGKHVITATQMLESMINNPRPTRAETTDVANAIYDGTTAIMLSGETAAGKYPVEAVKTMAKIAERTEQDIDYKSRMKRRELAKKDITTAISHATCDTAMDLEAKAIITVTISGFTARMVSRYKPDCPIIACSTSAQVCRQMNLCWGVQPVGILKEDTADHLFMAAIQTAKREGLIEKGDTVVLTAGVPLGVSGKTNMIRVIEVE